MNESPTVAELEHRPEATVQQEAGLESLLETYEIDEREVLKIVGAWQLEQCGGDRLFRRSYVNHEDGKIRIFVFVEHQDGSKRPPKRVIKT